MDAEFYPALLRTLDDFPLSDVDKAALSGRIMDMVMGKPLPTEGIEPVRVGSYTIQPERLVRCVPELAPLHQAHWRETEGYRHGLQFNPDYHRTVHDEADGRYLLLTARTEGTGEVVGNFGLVFGKSRHTQTGVACVAPTSYEDSVFIAPEHRRGRLFPRLVRYAEDAARHLGARELQLTAKLGNKVSEIIPRLGYTHCANQFSKIL